jgi:hypothetical protein
MALVFLLPIRAVSVFHDIPTSTLPTALRFACFYHFFILLISLSLPTTQNLSRNREREQSHQREQNMDEEEEIFNYFRWHWLAYFPQLVTVYRTTFALGSESVAGEGGVMAGVVATD